MQLKQHLVYLEQLCDHKRDAITAIKTHKKCVKYQYEKYVHSDAFPEGDMVLVYEWDHDEIGYSELKLMLLGPYILRRVLNKGVDELEDIEGKILRPRNRIYLKRY